MKVLKDSRRIFTSVQIHSLLQNLKQSSIVLSNEADLSAWLLRPFVGWADPTSLPDLVPLLPVCVALAVTSPHHA